MRRFFKFLAYRWGKMILLNLCSECQHLFKKLQPSLKIKQYLDCNVFTKWETSTKQSVQEGGGRRGALELLHYYTHYCDHDFPISAIFFSFHFQCFSRGPRLAILFRLNFYGIYRKVTLVGKKAIISNQGG